MRPLNRPMFRYGGPIKEGVMSGIREPHANGGRTIAGGNQMGTPMGNRTGFADPSSPGFWKRFLANYTPKNLTPKNLLSRIMPWKKAQAAKYVKPAATNIMARTGLGGAHKGVTGSGAGQQFLKNLKSFSFPGATKALGWAKKAKNLAFKYPKSALVGGVYVGPKIVANVPTPKWSGSWGIKDILVPDEIYNYETGRWFNSDDTDLKPSDKKILDEKITEKVTEKIVPEVPQKTEEEIRNERIQKYRDIMDIKGMNKEAAYDSLIAASKAVGESGDFKGDIKSGKLINDIIQSTSKAFDKPKKTRDAIDTLILKGEIEKDLYAAKPSEAEKAAAAFGISKEEYKKKLLGKSNAAEYIATSYAKTGRVDSTTVASGYKASGIIPKATITDTIVDDWINDNSGKTEIDYVKEVISKADGFGPGLYVVGDRAVLFDGTTYKYDY